MGMPLLISCSEDMEIGGGVSPSKEAFAFSINTDGAASNDTDKGSATRGAQATSATLASGFGVSCSAYPSSGTYASFGHGNYFYNIQAKPDTPTDYYWPEADFKVSFYAYYPHESSTFTVQSSAEAKGRPTYAYTVPSAIASQLDIMTSEKLDVSCATPSKVGLTFYHRLADIRFSCENIGAESVTLKSVAINGLKYSGTLSGSNWTLTGSTNSSSVNPFVLSVEQPIAAGATIDVTGTANHFIMLPQIVASGTQIFDVYATVADEAQHFYYTLPSALTLEAGKVYTFKLKLSDLLEVDENTDIQDWTEETDRTGIPTYQNNINTSIGIDGWESE